MNATMFEPHRSENATILQNLLAAPPFAFDGNLFSQVPEEYGLYLIAHVDKDTGEQECLKAGSSARRKKGGLRARLKEHYGSGDQKNPKKSSDFVSKVMDRLNCDKPTAQAWINNCIVQWIVEKDRKTCEWAEYYMLSVLRRPRWSR